MEQTKPHIHPHVAKARQGFKIHLIVYLLVNALLTTMNLMTDPANLWFYWPLLGWGIGILAHGYLVSQKK